MNKKLPTREQCKAIVNKSEAFYCSETEVHGYKVEMYNYMLASYSDFVEHDAFELRGLTFVYNPTTDTWERHLGLQKFFNIDQNKDWMYEDIKHKSIVSCADKLDGSMITGIKINNKLFMKSKMSFNSEQAQISQDIVDKNNTIKLGILNLLNTGYTPIFELISPHNQIVINYPETELVLLQIRNSSSGGYMDYEFIKSTSIKLGIRYSTNSTDSIDNDLYKLQAASQKYTKDELVDILGNKKFDTFNDICNYIKSL